MAIRCPQCQRENRDGARFCRGCGGQSDRRSDICALGAMLYQLLTCQHPLTRGSPHALPSVTSVNPLVSELMSSIIARAVEYDPELRWQDVAEITQALSGGRRGSQQPLRVPQTQAATAQPPATAQPRAPSQAAPPSKGGASPTQLLAEQSSRLISKIAQLSYPQLMIGVGALVLAVLVLMPAVSGFIQAQLPWLWANVPGYAIIPPAAWFAARRPGAAFLAYLPLSLAGWLRATYEVDMGMVMVAVLASGLIAELLLQLTGKLAQGQASRWPLELIGATACGVVVTFMVDLIAFGQLPSPFAFLSSAALGAAGWLFGDWFYRTWTLTHAGQGSISQSR